MSALQSRAHTSIVNIRAHIGALFPPLLQCSSLADFENLVAEKYGVSDDSDDEVGLNTVGDYSDSSSDSSSDSDTNLSEVEKEK